MPTPNLIVFDIDGVLCWQREVELFNIDTLHLTHPECPLIIFPMTKSDYIHCFIPYLDVLIEYLINAGSRIAFFSAGVESRNKMVIKELLIELFGEKRYGELTDSGQFEIFSSHHMRHANHKYGENQSNYIKDLNIVLKKDETILNSILIEDQIAYAAYDQHPCIMGIMLESILDNIGEYNFSKNATYYLLGIFINYFTVNHDLLPLRVWVETFFLEKTNGSSLYSNPYYPERFYIPDKDDKFVMELIDSGLKEVQKKYPNAILYKSMNIEKELFYNKNSKLKINI